MTAKGFDGDYHFMIVEISGTTCITRRSAGPARRSTAEYSTGPARRPPWQAQRRARAGSRAFARGLAGGHLHTPAATR